jgi:hypothetical protein
MTGRYDLVLGQNLLNSLYSIDEHFDIVHKHVHDNGIYALAETITDNNDAWLNTLLFTLNPKHVRAPRAEEIIGVAAEYFDMLEFLRFSSHVSLEIPEGKVDSVLAQIDSMPPKVVSSISPAVDGNICSFSMLTGLFVWQKNL